MTLLLQLQDPSAQARPVEPPVSLERIRRGLESPPETVTVVSSNPDLPPVFRLEIRDRLLPYEHLWQRDWVPAYVKPTRGLYHHEFLEQVTPDLFRAVSLHPCCPVLPLLSKLRKKGPDQNAQAKARIEVKQALEELLARKREEEARARVTQPK